MCVLCVYTSKSGWMAYLNTLLVWRQGSLHSPGWPHAIIPPLLPECWHHRHVLPQQAEIKLVRDSSSLGSNWASWCWSLSVTFPSQPSWGRTGVLRFLTDGTSDKQPLQMAYVCLKWEMCFSQKALWRCRSFAEWFAGPFECNEHVLVPHHFSK